MEWNEWNDGDADDPEATHNRDFEPWPPAPLPPHERTWRHPSELGATTVHVGAPAQPAMSRKATVATVAVGVLLVAGAVRLMIPSGGATTGASDAAGLTIVTSGIERLTTIGVGTEPAPTPPPATPAPITSPPTFESLLVTTSFIAPVTATEPTAPPASIAELTVLQTEEPTYALVLASGRYLATSSAAVSGLDTVRVQMPSGDMADAQVIRADGPIALLDLTSQTAAAGPHGATPDPGAPVTVSAPDGPVAATVGEGNELGYHRLISDRPLHESGPVFDDDGVVVGMCTRMHDTDWLVPVLLLDELAAQQPGDGTPTTDVTSTAPATATTEPTTSTSSTTTSTSSTTTSTSSTTTSTSSTSTTSTTEPTTSSVPVTVD